MIGLVFFKGPLLLLCWELVGWDQEDEVGGLDNNPGIDQDGIGGGSEKWSDSVGCERQGGVEDDFRVLACMLEEWSCHLQRWDMV